GDYNQLATTLLQIENEFYGTIRPKRVIRTGERPLHALRERGVEYVEVRCMDLDPFVPVGIEAQTMRFIDVFLLHCLLADSPPDTPEEIVALARNQQRTAARGREPGMKLERGAAEVALVDWGAEIVEACAPIAARLDRLAGGDAHAQALRSARERLAEPATTPSARVLATMLQDFRGSFVEFGRAQSQQIKEGFVRMPLAADAQARLSELARRSVEDQERLEAADTLPFEIFRQQYLDIRGLGV
ncbi:MAG TPA: glutamate--cysteine ligase, partial [Caldimonas sp.]|nr:glutamate--cysteine ligase [Caldimonas sp.]